MNPYEVLGLAEDESDERTIKRAYAKLLKQHRPDQDPEGFTRVRQAYQWVMSMREVGSAHVAPRLDVSSSAPAAVVEPSASTLTEVVVTESATAAAQASAAVRPTRQTLPAADDVPDLWSAAVAAVTRTFSLPTTAEHDDLRGRAIEELTLLRRQGLGSLVHWRALVLDALNGRYELALAWLDDADLELLLEDLPLTTMEAAFKGVAKHDDSAALLRLATCWVTSIEQSRRLGAEDGSTVLRWMGWLTLLDVTLAMRLVVVAEAGPISRTTVHQADRLLAAAPAAKKLPDHLRWYVIGRILGTQPRHLRDPRVDEVVGLTAQLPATDPLRVLLMGPAGLRPKYQTQASSAAGLDVGKILLRLPNILLFLSIFAVIGDALKPAIGGLAVVISWAVVIAWWRNAATVSGWLYGSSLSQPPYLMTGWAVTWFSYIGAGTVALAAPGSELMRWSAWLGATLVFMRTYTALRTWLRSAHGESGWRSLIPKWHAVLPSYTQERKLTATERWSVATVALVWTATIIWGLLQVAPFNLPVIRDGIAYVWLSGPATFLFLTIRAWLVMWRRERDPGLAGIVYWTTWTVLWQAVPLLVLPWLWDWAKLGWMIELQALFAALAMCLMGALAATIWLRVRDQLGSR